MKDKRQKAKEIGVEILVMTDLFLEIGNSTCLCVNGLIMFNIVVII